jgi:hypothetical protein
MIPHKQAINTPLTEMVFGYGASSPPSVPLPGLKNYKGQPLYCAMDVVNDVLTLDISDTSTEDQPTSGTTASRVTIRVTVDNSTITQSLAAKYDGSDIRFGVQVSPDMSVARLVIEKIRPFDPKLDTFLRFLAIQDDRDAGWYNMAWIDPQFTVKAYARLVDAGAAVVLPWDDAMLAAQNPFTLSDDDSRRHAGRYAEERSARGPIEVARVFRGGGAVSGPIGYASPP